MKRTGINGILVMLLSLMMVISMMPAGVLAWDGPDFADSGAETESADENAEAADYTDTGSETELHGDDAGAGNADEQIPDTEYESPDGDAENHDKDGEPADETETSPKAEPESSDELAVEPDPDAEEAAPEEVTLKAAAAVAPTKMWLDHSDTNGIPARIDLFKVQSGTSITYQLFLPGNVDAANCFLSWDGDMDATINNTTYASGACPVPAPDGTVTYTFRNGTQTAATFIVTCYQGSEYVQPVFIEIDESNGNPTIAQMDADSSHNVTCTGTINIDGKWYELDKMKGRGNASWKESRDKKPYNITLGKKISFPGIDEPATKKYSLLAEVLDHSLLCNRSGYHLAHQLGIGQDTASADVWMNGEYQGCYTITPKTDSYVTKDGFMIEQDNYKEPAVADGGDPQFTLQGLEEASGWDSCYNRITVKKMGDNLLMNGGVVDESPANMMAAAGRIQTWLQDAWDAIRSDTGYNSKGKYYTDYIDIESFAKMYLMHEYVKSYDVCAGSILYHRDGQTDDFKLIAGPAWDLDNAMGSVYRNSSLGQADDLRNGDRRSGQGAFISLVTEYKTSVYKTISKHPDFMEEVYRQYNLNRSAFDNLATDTQTMIDEIGDSAKMNHIKVQDLGHTTGKNNHYYGSQTTLGSGQYRQVYLATTNSKTDWINYAKNLKTFITTRSLWFQNTYYDPDFVDPSTCAHQFTDTVTDASCTADGSVTHYCPICKYSYTEVLPKIAHNYQDGVCTMCGEHLVTASIVCSEGASVTVYETQDITGPHVDNAETAYPRNSDSGMIDCSGDGQINFVVNIAPGYQLVSVSAEPAASYKNLKPPADTDIENGYRLTKVNADLTINVVAECPHDLTHHPAIAAACETAGSSEYYSCGICGKYFSDEDATTVIQENSWVIPAKGHTAAADAAVPATCTETGLTAGSHCSVCNEVLEAQEVIPALGHDWSEWEVTTPATCTEKGIETRTCSRCHTSETREIEAAGHTVVEDAAVAPTCTDTGLTAGSHCSVCNEVLEAQEVIPALGHRWDEGTVTTEPDCTNAGVRTYTCQNDPSHTRTEVIDAFGHTAVEDAAVAPTCTDTGLTAGSHCSVCDAVIVSQQIIPALGHDWSEWEITTPATCTEKGIETRTCSRCHTSETREIEAAGHTSVADAAVPATCTDTGLTAGSHCSVCNEILEAQETIPALGHDWSEWEVTTPATCTEKGIETRTCSRCHTSETREIEAAGHTAVEDKEVAPTCTETGLTAGSHCSVCNEVLEAQEVIPALCHSWSEWEITTPATCTEKGIETRTCSRCHTSETRDIEATGHAVVEDAAVAPTCTETGLTAGSHCSVCNEVLEAQEVIPALGHSWGEVTYTWADDNSSVTATRTCKKDTGHVETETVSTSSAVTKPATCEASGVKTYTAAFTNSAFTVQTRTESIAATGHRWSEVTYTWAADNKSVTALRTCINDASHTETETAEATYSVTADANCTSAGTGIWTSAAFENSVFAVQTKEVTIEAYGHRASETAAHAAGCTEAGNSAYWTCERCRKFFSDAACTAEIGEDSWIIPAVGHNWDDPDYTWAADNSTLTAERVCKNDASHKETETASATSRVTREATCDLKGVRIFTATFENDAFEEQTKTEDIDALGHDWEREPTVDVPPTCGESGHQSTHCTRCSKTKDETTIPATGLHTFGAWETIREATATETGLRERKCTVCGAAEQEVIPVPASIKNLWASRHDVGKVLFKWTGTNKNDPESWQVHYRIKKIEGGSWSKWTDKTLSGSTYEFECPVPANYVVEIHARAKQDSPWSRGIITTPAGGKYQAMKTVYVKGTDGKRIPDSMTAITIPKGKTCKFTPDYEYSILDYKARPRLYPNHMLYDVYDSGTYSGWDSGVNSSIISITKADGSKYKAGIAEGTVTIKGDKAGNTTLICRAPNGRTKVYTIVVK